jgi:hypothetical protein
MKSAYYVLLPFDQAVDELKLGMNILSDCYTGQ